MAEVRSTRSRLHTLPQAWRFFHSCILAAGRAHVPRRPAGCCSRPATSSSRCARRSNSADHIACTRADSALIACARTGLRRPASGRRCDRPPPHRPRRSRCRRRRRCRRSPPTPPPRRSRHLRRLRDRRHELHGHVVVMRRRGARWMPVYGCGELHACECVDEVHGGCQSTRETGRRLPPWRESRGHGRLANIVEGSR